MFGGFGGIRLNQAGGSFHELTIVNHGGIHTQSGAALNLASSFSSITNTGTISSNQSIGIFSNNTSGTSINNTGTINAANYGIRLTGNGDSTFVNTGTITVENAPYGTAFAYADDSAAGHRDIILNTGQLLGKVDLGAGDDTFDGSDGIQTGVIRGEAGNDIIFGGSGNEVLYGGTDDDTIVGGGGDDTLYADTGNDLVRGAMATIRSIQVRAKQKRAVVLVMTLCSALRLILQIRTSRCLAGAAMTSFRTMMIVP